MPTLSSDGDGRLHCGVCGYAAVPVALWKGKTSVARITNGVPLVVLCVFCDKPWEHCDRICTGLAKFLAPYRSLAKWQGPQALGGSQ